MWKSFQQVENPQIVENLVENYVFYVENLTYQQKLFMIHLKVKEVLL